MDASAVITFPRARAASGAGDIDGVADDLDSTGQAVREIDAAIALVASRAARRVRLTALPFVEAAAPIGLAHARAAGMGFTFERVERAGVATVTIGPLEPATAVTR